MLFILDSHVLKPAEGSQLSNELSNANDCSCCPHDMSSQNKDKNSLIQCSRKIKSARLVERREAPNYYFQENPVALQSVCGSCLNSALGNMPVSRHPSRRAWRWAQPAPQQARTWEADHATP